MTLAYLTGIVLGALLGRYMWAPATIERQVARRCAEHERRVRDKLESAIKFLKETQ